MHVPVPRNRLVAFTLAGALLTMAVAAGLAVPGFGPAAESTGDTSGPTADADAPEPAQNFTPDVQTQPDYEEHEDEEHEDEEHEDDDGEYEDDDEEEYDDEDDDEEYEDDDDDYEEDEYGED